MLEEQNFNRNSLAPEGAGAKASTIPQEESCLERDRTKAPGVLSERARPQSKARRAQAQGQRGWRSGGTAPQPQGQRGGREVRGPGPSTPAHRPRSRSGAPPMPLLTPRDADLKTGILPATSVYWERQRITVRDKQLQRSHGKGQQRRGGCSWSCGARGGRCGGQPAGEKQELRAMPVPHSRWPSFRAGSAQEMRWADLPAGACEG